MSNPIKLVFVVVDAVKLRRSFVKITWVLKFRTLKINIQKNHNEKNEVEKNIKKMWGKLAFIVYPNVVIVLYLRFVHKKNAKSDICFKTKKIRSSYQNYA